MYNIYYPHDLWMYYILEMYFLPYRLIGELK